MNSNSSHISALSENETEYVILSAAFPNEHVFSPPPKKVSDLTSPQELMGASACLVQITNTIASVLHELLQTRVSECLVEDLNFIAL